MILFHRYIESYIYSYYLLVLLMVTIVFIIQMEHIGVGWRVHVSILSII